MRDADLRDWSEYSNATRFRNTFLAGLHDEKLVDYERSPGLVRLSEPAARYVEARLPAWKV